MSTREALIEGYLARLGVASRPAPSLQALGLLVARHLERIAFENLDVVAGMRQALGTETTLHKVVVRRRGGFCYELNEAFGALLESLGFTLRRVEARVWSAPRGAFGPPFDHLALVVTLPEGEFLTDVGFGDNNRAPMRLPRDSQQDVSGQYTLQPLAADRWLLARPDRPLYELTLQAQSLAAFEPMYRYHQSSPESLFAKGLICTRATARGRITISGNRLIVVDGEARSESLLDDVEAALQTHFGISKESQC